MGPSPATTEPTGPSSTSPRASSRRSQHPGTNSALREAPYGRPRQGAPSLSRGRRLRLARGYPGKASAEASFSVSREASFSLSLEAGSSAVRRPPPRPTLPTTRHVSLMLQPLPQSQPDGGSTPQDGRRDPRSHQRHTGRDRPLCPTTMSYHCVLPLCPRPAPYRLGKGTTGIADHCVQTLCP